MQRAARDGAVSCDGLPRGGRAGAGRRQGRLREVPINTPEGRWTGLRNPLRLFRGVNEVCLHRNVTMFEWSYNIERVNEAFLWTLFVCDPPPAALHELVFLNGMGFMSFRMPT